MKKIENLAVRYRPKRLADLLGNKQVKRALRAYLQKGAFPKSTLIYGPTGSGKTTLARIAAKALNCQNPDNGFNPCEKCYSCTSSLEWHGSIWEINCTVRRKLDDMRQAIQVSLLYPLHKCRVLILDEVQGASH